MVPKRQRRRKNRRLNDNATEKMDWKEQTWKHSPEPKVKVLIPMYEFLQVFKCEKCGRIVAEPKELIRILKGKKE